MMFKWFKKDPNAKELFDNVSDQITEFVLLGNNSLLAVKLDNEFKSRALTLAEASKDIEEHLLKENLLIGAKAFFEKKLKPEKSLSTDVSTEINIPSLSSNLYIELFEHPRMEDLKNVTFETNTTQKLHDSFRDYLNNQRRFTVTWSCSPKLSVSGEPWSTAIKPTIASQYNTVQGSDLYLKFVVADRTDIDEAGKAVDEYREAGIDCPVYLMPLGGRSEEYNLNVKEVANICMEKGWRFTPRLHISLFGNAWGT